MLRDGTLNPSDYIPKTSAEQLKSDPKIQAQIDGYCKKVDEKYCEKFKEYIKNGTQINETDIRQDALKNFPELRRLIEMGVYQKLEKETYYEWSGGECSECGANSGCIFSTKNPPSCGLPPVHPNCGCSVDEVSEDELKRRFTNKDLGPNSLEEVLNEKYDNDIT